MLVSLTCSAQDIHWSQFYESAILRNPGLMGIYKEDYKITGQYRDQWSSVGKGYRTGQLNAEFRFPVNKVNDYLGIGVAGYSDKAGRIDFKTIGIYPAINYHKSLEDGNNSYLSLGFTFGYLNRTIDVSKMTFDNQYQNGSFNPDNGSGEQQMPEAKLSSWDLGAGVSFSSSPSEQSHFYLGVAAYHFTHPKRSFYFNNDAVRLFTRWSVSAGYSCTFNDTWGGMVNANYSNQGPHKETMLGGLLKWTKMEMDDTRGFALYGGAFYRFGDAVVPTLKIDWKGQSFGFSYDINISSLKDATRQKGGFEISVYSSGFLNGGGGDNMNTTPVF